MDRLAGGFTHTHIMAAPSVPENIPDMHITSKSSIVVPSDKPLNAASVKYLAGVDGWRGLVEDSLKFSRSSERDQPPISPYSKETSNPASRLQ